MYNAGLLRNLALQSLNLENLSLVFGRLLAAESHAFLKHLDLSLFGLQVFLCAAELESEIDELVVFVEATAERSWVLALQEGSLGFGLGNG